MKPRKTSWQPLLSIIPVAKALIFDPEQVGFNLNENKTATNPLDYWGEWTEHQYHPSPENWRMPFYSLFLDRFVNGDPSNDNANGTQFEHDPLSNQLRHGGDVRGLIDSFDYLQGMGIQALYIIGMPHINFPWSYDGFSPLDLTLLDHHLGDIDAWRAMTTEAHRRGMYIVLENTFATMGDLLGFEGFLNVSTPFDAGEHDFVWKDTRRYHDFAAGNDWIPKCDYPRFWDAQGHLVTNLSHLLVGCRDSEFDQYGEVAAFGDYPEWQKQISKFAFVQDRLREWRSDVREKIEHFSCMTINMLDIDGFRIDKALQVTVDSQGEWSDKMRQCARKLGKNNFYIPGEIVGGNTLGSVYIGRGKEPQMQVENITEVLHFTNKSDPGLFIREPEKAALDAAAFHYTLYRGLTRFLGMDGIYAAEGDPPVNFVETWNTILQTNDLINANTGKFDPRRIPLVNWGEEQAFYILENTNANYVFGRQPMSSSQAWQLHGCYKVGSTKYANFPVESAAWGCLDHNVSLDHRDPSHPVRNIIKLMFEMRKNYPVLNDGYYLQQLSNQTFDDFLPGSNGTATETGLWSVLRAPFIGIQDFKDTGQGNLNIWLVYQNDKHDKTYKFNCSDPKTALISPYDEGTVVKNLFPPHEEYTLEKGPVKLNVDAPEEFNGCLRELSIPAWGYKVLVPKEKFVAPSPVITKLVPGHDYRLFSSQKSGGQVRIEVHFSQEMDCDGITKGLQIESRTEDGSTAHPDPGSVQCFMTTDPDPPVWVGAPQTVWAYSADIVDLSHGIHDIAIVNATSKTGKTTNSVDHFLLRVGDDNNPMVFPSQANYSQILLHNDKGKLTVSHTAAGADKWRYSLNWGTTYSDWLDYKGGNDTLAPRVWSGTKEQAWDGDHVIVEYWSRIAGSSDHVQHGDANWKNKPPRHVPHLWLKGPWNQHGFDAGLANQMKLNYETGLWTFNFMTEWPAQTSLSMWGINPDGQPDQTQIFGDIDGDSVLDRLPLKTLLGNYINVTDAPRSPYLSYRISLNDATLHYELIPTGLIPLRVRHGFKRLQETVSRDNLALPKFRHSVGPMEAYQNTSMGNSVVDLSHVGGDLNEVNPLSADAGAPNRRTVLIATMEYDIEDWEIKIKIGGLGVMAQLMGKNLGHQDLIWVVPCVGGIDYPTDTPADPMEVTILGYSYVIDVQYHILRNITYVLLDAPIFRQQTKAEPYPPRMDDLDSAIYYSAWNACIAEAIKRFPVDLYHINDYHGAAAPTSASKNYPVFYLRIHQKGFGAVGVSKKYGKRSYARYPIFWGLKEIRALPNPDPSDSEEWTRGETPGEAVVDPTVEARRAPLRRQAQEWAGLDQNPKAELFVFVGRWSMQKGVDLIADVFPAILEENPDVQLICVGPVIDLYGSFAALKLKTMMKKKGALGVGARVGGLGQMPGWWYTVESTTTKNLLHQFKSAITEALASRTEIRALMRARAAKQRFPVQQWVEDLETLQTTAIEKHRKYAAAHENRNFLNFLSDRPSGINTPLFRGSRANSRAPSATSRVVGEKHDYNLQKVEPFFTDPNKEYYHQFEKKLEDLTGKNSESQMCIEEFLKKSEKKWFNRYRHAQLGRSPASSIFRVKRSSREPSVYDHEGAYSNSDNGEEVTNQFLIDKDYVPPSGLKAFLLRRIGDWPLYSIALAFVREIGQSAEKLYVVATIYLFASIMWWFVFRGFKSMYALSIPFAFYGVAFFLVGMTPFVKSVSGRGWTQNVATGFYAVAASSGSVFFALNFGDEGGAPITSWVYRACVIQGTQQIYVVALWYWGSTLAKLAGSGGSGMSLIQTNPHLMTAIGVGIACVMWAVGLSLWAGLPNYYRQAPDKVPSFYKALFRRKIIVWFWFMVIVQNYWLSAPYGRNWLYLWSSQHVPAWQMAILVAVFFLGVWAGFLYIFGVLSNRYSWILPIFAIGLGAPRWCQMLWSTSNIGLYVPWAGGHVASAFAGRALWLWLGVLDAIQGVGFGMILLSTLTRFHIAFTLIAGQVLGSIATILARAFAPNKIGPGDVFPDFSAGFSEGLSKAWFWIALLFQLSINLTCFLFFRKGQLSKP
ncbi:hypothetical protein H2199_009052 [Coniosporium tulheliwenetii]|uniref:Uncharacterized protein n=1 Tax=Coniosporium tulheliwenetii TaxID=3383036 RepID=A0ACC2YG43_9PEZI|nr:hypothetical protein H2199_009052 [Cladosporium sp. JES 115]